MSQPNSQCQVTVHAGGARSARAARLDALLAEHWGRAVLIVPTHRAARQRLERVLRTHEIPGCTGRPVRDFKSFAESILLGEGETAPKANDLRRRLILESALVAVRAAQPDLNAPDPATAPGLVAHLLEIITQLKQAALEPAEFRTRLERNAALTPLDAMICAVYEAYQGALKDAGLYDVPGLYWRAYDIARAKKPAALAGVERLLLDGFDDFTPSEFRLLTALMPHVSHAAFGLAFDLQGSRHELFDRPAHTLGQLCTEFDARLIEYEAAQCATLSHYAADNIFWRNRPAPCSGLTANLRVAPCTDAQHEAETIARAVRAVIAAGASPERIAVVYRNLAPAAPWLAAALAEFCVPAQLHYAPPLAASAAAAFLVSVYHAIERWDRERVAEVLASPLFAPRGRNEAALLASGSVARRALVLEGRAEWTARLAAYARQEQGQKDTELPAVSAALAALAEAFDALPGTAPVAAHCAQADALLHVLGVDAAMSTWTDASADTERAHLAALRGLLGDLARAHSGAVTREDFAHLLERALRDTPGARAAARGGVQCMDAANARHLDFDHVFFGGINEGAVPQATPPNAIYNETERRRLQGASIALEGRRERAAREMALYHHVLALPRETLTLSYRLNEGGREATPSPFLVQTTELLATHPKVCAPPPLADAFLPPLATAASEREVRNVALAQRIPNTEALFPGAASGAAIERARFTAPDFDAHDGQLAQEPAVAALAQRYDAAHIFSVAQIETYAQCPFQFFLKRGLRVEEEDTPEAELDPRLRGSLMHRILQQFHQQFRGQAVVDLDEATALRAMEQLVAEVFEERGWQAKAAPEGVLAAERRRMTLLMRRYLAWAREKHGDAWKPEHFEVAFGPAREDATDAPPAPAFALALPSGIAQFSGRIDRVDVCGEALRLIDYKTGGLPAAGEIKQGVSLQLGVYALACEQLLFPGQSCAEAVFVRVGGATDQRAIGGKNFDRAAYGTMLLAQIDRCLRGIREGVFPPLPRTATCHGCTSAHICRHEKARIERKAPPALLADAACAAAPPDDL